MLVLCSNRHSDKLRLVHVGKSGRNLEYFINLECFDLYRREQIHGIYLYLEMIGSTTPLATSGQRSHNFSALSSVNNDGASLQPIIADLCMRPKSICECCIRIVHKTDACIIRGPKFLPPSLQRNMNQSNALHGD